ncbi:MAG: hypothetical protein ACXW3D_02055 [Caulobacteraceae bacterium]
MTDTAPQNSSNDLPPPDLTVTEARQGRRGMHVLVILVASLALAAIGLAAVFFSHTDDNAGLRGQRQASPAVAAATDTPQRPARQQDDSGLKPQTGPAAPG